MRALAAHLIHNGHVVLRLRRTLPAEPADVYRALTDADELARWWGPHGFTVTGLDFRPEAGRGYRIAMRPPEGDAFYLAGEFREVEPPHRLAFTFRWDPPDPDDRETLAELALEPRGDATELDLTQHGFATEERRALHEEGWSQSLERLAELLARPD
jgi:uncharacterized protein YndB with AHSA1/START domain